MMTTEFAGNSSFHHKRRIRGTGKLLNREMVSRQSGKETAPDGVERLRGKTIISRVGCGVGAEKTINHSNTNV